MTWVAVRFCNACGVELSDHEYAYSDGVCPHCGATSNGTFVDAAKRSVRKAKRKWRKELILVVLGIILAGLLSYI